MASRRTRTNRTLRGITCDTAVTADPSLAAFTSVSLGGNTVLTVTPENSAQVISALRTGEESVREALCAQRDAANAAGDRAGAAAASAGFNAFRATVAKLEAHFAQHASADPEPAAEPAPEPASEDSAPRSTTKRSRRKG